MYKSLSLFSLAPTTSLAVIFAIATENVSTLLLLQFCLVHTTSLAVVIIIATEGAVTLLLLLLLLLAIVF
jgi:hypothetical protein